MVDYAIKPQILVYKSNFSHLCSAKQYPASSLYLSWLQESRAHCQMRDSSNFTHKFTHLSSTSQSSLFRILLIEMTLEMTRNYLEKVKESTFFHFRQGFVGGSYKIYTVKRWAKEWVLGCVNSHPGGS